MHLIFRDLQIRWTNMLGLSDLLHLSCSCHVLYYDIILLLLDSFDDKVDSYMSVNKTDIINRATEYLYDDQIMTDRKQQVISVLINLIKYYHMLVTKNPVLKLNFGKLKNMNGNPLGNFYVLVCPLRSALVAIQGSHADYVNLPSDIIAYVRLSTKSNLSITDIKSIDHKENLSITFIGYRNISNQVNYPRCKFDKMSAYYSFFPGTYTYNDPVILTIANQEELGPDPLIIPSRLNRLDHKYKIIDKITQRYFLSYNYLGLISYDSDCFKIPTEPDILF